VLLLLPERFGANTEHTITPSHKGATRIMLCEEHVSMDSFLQPHAISYGEGSSGVTFQHAPSAAAMIWLLLGSGPSPQI